MTESRGLALVTGAGGFIGGHAARSLAEEGWRVRALLRDPAAALVDLRHPAIELLLGDVRDAGAMRAAVSAATCVVHAAGCTRAAPRKTVWNVGLEGTLNLHRAARDQGVGQFVFISSFAVYSSLREPYDERSALTPSGDSYGDAKIAAEEALLGAAGGPTVAVLRPPLVYGPGSWYLSSRPLQAARRGRLFVPGDGQFPTVYGFVDNLVDAVAAAITRGAHGVFNVFDGAMPYVEFVRPYAEMAATRPRTLPMWAVRGLAAAFALPVHAAGWWTPFSPAAVDFLVHGHRRAPERASRARDELGWAPRVEFREGIDRTRRWFGERGLLG